MRTFGSELAVQPKTSERVNVEQACSISVRLLDSLEHGAVAWGFQEFQTSKVHVRNFKNHTFMTGLSLF